MLERLPRAEVGRERQRADHLGGADRPLARSHRCRALPGIRRRHGETLLRFGSGNAEPRPASATTVAVVSVRSEAAKTRRAFCSAVSSASGEPLAATASRVDHWILVEYSGAWESEALGGSVLSPELKEHLRAQLAALAHSRLLLVKQTGRRAAGRRPRALRQLTARRGAVLRAGARAPRRAARRRPRGRARRRRTGGTPVEGPLYVVCTHGKRDRCCALHGLPLYDALRRETDPGRVWQSTHVGGDRFAGNVVVLPHGLYYGRVAPGRRRPRARRARRRGDRARPLPRAQRLPVPGAGGRAARSASPRACSASTTSRSSGRRATRTAAGGSASGRRTRRPRARRRRRSLADEPAYLTCDSAEPSRARRYLVDGAPRRQPVIRRKPSRTRRRTSTSRPSSSSSPGRSATPERLVALEARAHLGRGVRGEADLLALEDER